MIDVNPFNFLAIACKTLLLVWLMGWSTQANAQCDCGRIDELQKRLKNEANAQKRAEIFNELSSKYYESEQKQLAIRYANDALSYTIRNRDKKGQARALYNKANVNYDETKGDEGSLTATVDLFDKARAIYEELGDKEGLATTYEGLGKFYKKYAYLTSGDNANALEAVKSLEKAEGIREGLLKNGSLTDEQKEVQRKKLGKIFGTLIEVYFNNLNDNKKAQQFYNRSIDILGQNDDNATAQLGRQIKRNEGKERERQNLIILIVSIGVAVMVLLSIGLVINIGRARKKNRLLDEQKTKLARNNKMIEEKNELIEAKNRQMESHNQELAELNKQMNRVNKEVELTNFELNEKNEEINQTAEALKEQSLALESQKVKLEKAYETITLLSQIGQDLTSSLDFEKTLNTLENRVKEMMPVDGFSVGIFEENTNELNFRYVTEFSSRQSPFTISMEDTHHPAVWCIKNNKEIIIHQKEDLNAQSFYDTSINASLNSMMYYPMLNEDSVIGAVSVQSRLIAAYTPYYADIFKTLVLYSSIAISNAENYRTLHSTLDDLKTTQDQLVEAEKMASLGNLVAGVAHEINTPVGIGVTAASRLETKTNDFIELYNSKKMKKSDLEKFLSTNKEGTKIILNNLNRAAKLVQGFKQVAVGQSNEDKQKFNLKTYIDDTLLALQPKLKNKPYELQTDIDELVIESYSGAYSQIITNLVMNSIIHAFKGRDKGTISLSVKKHGERLKMTYSDDGNGIAPEILDKVFDPFVTTNREGGGTGLGMNILYNLAVQKLKGKVDFKSGVGEGVTFYFDLPMNV